MGIEIPNKSERLIFIRIFEGDVPPYYIFNDPNIYVRTGRITKQIDIVSPEHLELMIYKKQKAEKERISNIELANQLLNNAKKYPKRVIEKDIDSATMADFLKKVSSNENEWCYSIQPSYPRNIISSLSDFEKIFEGVKLRSFHPIIPADNLRAISNGLFKVQANEENGYYGIEYYNTNGLVYFVDDISWDGVVYLTHFIERILMLFKISQIFYERMKYVGMLYCSIQLKISSNTTVSIYDPIQEYGKLTPILFMHNIEFNFDTTVFTDNESYLILIKNEIKKLLWSLGVADSKFVNIFDLEISKMWKKINENK